MPSTRPTCFLVGAPKAGTSLLAVLLNRHPEIVTGRVKEPNYFNTDFDLPRPRSEAEYLALYNDPVARIRADCSILYLASHAAPAAIKAFAPEARILVVLREPVDAMYSWHGQMTYTSNEPLADFRAALDAEADRKQGRRLPPAGTARTCPEMLCYRDLMRYHLQIARYLAHFRRDQILFLRYENLAAETLPTYRRVLEFLDVDPAFEPEVDRVNPSKVRRFSAAHAAAKRLLARPARALLPLPLRMKLIRSIDRMTSREQKRPPLDPDLKAALRRECGSDIAALSRLLGEDFSSWSETP